MILQKGKCHSILEYREAYLSPEGTIEKKSAYEYEMYLHNNNILVDKYDRTNLLQASRLHSASTINGMLFQFIWFSESKQYYNLGVYQNPEYIDIYIKNKEKNIPDFFDMKNFKGVELKMTQSQKYIVQDWRLYDTINKKYVSPDMMHKADIVIVCSINNSSIVEFYCIKEKNCYNVLYKVKSQRLEKILNIFDKLKVS